MDAIIVAGGRSTRLGRPKADVVLDGSTLLHRTLTAVGSSGTIVVVGPPRDDLPASVLQTREEPAFGGPVAGLAAGLVALHGPARGEEVLVLACDMPLVDRAVTGLMGSGPAEAVLLRDRGRVQPLAAKFRVDDLRAAISGLEVAGASMHSLLSRLTITPLDVAPGTTDDVDCADDLVTTGAVGDHMIRAPYRLSPGATVMNVREFFEGDHVHAALVLDRDVLTTVVVRGDLVGAEPDSPAANRGRLDGRTVTPTRDAELVRREMLSDGIRRLAVIDDLGRLLGLLCLKRSGLGFCSDVDVAHSPGYVSPI